MGSAIGSLRDHHPGGAILSKDQRSRVPAALVRRIGHRVLIATAAGPRLWAIVSIVELPAELPNRGGSAPIVDLSVLFVEAPRWQTSAQGQCRLPVAVRESARPSHRIDYHIWKVRESVGSAGRSAPASSPDSADSLPRNRNGMWSAMHSSPESCG